MYFQVLPKMFRVDSCIRQIIWQWIPDCWTGDRESTTFKGATANTWNRQLTMPAEPTRGLQCRQATYLTMIQAERWEMRHTDDHIHLTERVFVVTVGHKARWYKSRLNTIQKISMSFSVTWLIQCRNTHQKQSQLSLIIHRQTFT